MLLSGSINLKEEELKGLDNLKILLAGTKVENPLGLFGVKELSVLFRELSENYGLIIIDSGSVSGYPDTLNLIPMADALLIVARKGRTTYSTASKTIAKLRKINGSLTGLIFSCV